MILRLFLFLVLLSSCGRPLTETEAAFIRGLQGEQLDTSRVRLVKGAPVAAVTFRRKARPRVACRERIMPPIKGSALIAASASVQIRCQTGSTSRKLGFKRAIGVSFACQALCLEHYATKGQEQSCDLRHHNH